MTDALPSATVISRAEPSLRQVHDLAIVIEANCSFAPDYVVDAQKTQLLFNLRTALLTLGYDMQPVAKGPRLAVNNEKVSI